VATTDPDPVPTPDPSDASVATAPAGAVVPVEDPPETTKQKPVVVATENHLTVFQSGDVEVTHAGVAVSRKQADELTEQAARHGVRLIDITPEKGE
jgi:hypothetical protein